MSETNAIITYEGNQINLFFDERSDYVSLTDIYKAWNRYGKSINAWLKTKQTLEFLDAWEKKNNRNYDPTHLSRLVQLARKRNGLSAQSWIEPTHAIGIFTRSGERAGTYAHKDIAIKFASWLSPTFELFLVEEIQRLKKIEEQKYSLQLLSHEQVLALVQLKEVFRYVVNQVLAEEANRDIFVAQSGAKNPYAEFNKYRNQMLNISPKIINERIKQYCIDNNIALTGSIINKSKREKLLMMDSYESVGIAVWDFLNAKGEINSLNLAKLVENMIRIEKGEVMRNNEDNLFQKHQNLGEFTDFQKFLEQHTHLKSAREVIEYRKELEQKKLGSPLNKQLKGLLAVPPPPKK